MWFASMAVKENLPNFPFWCISKKCVFSQGLSFRAPIIETNF